MGTPQEIIELVDRFREQSDSYRSPSYGETALRREFLDPFIKALGWDIDNKAGYAEAYKDVVHEDAIKIGGSTKAPDYSLRIGGVRKFFIEAKKPSVNIAQDISPAFQLRRYAWSAGLPLSILTDFQEFAVYDCRVRPQQNDKASTARIKYFTYDQYDEHWDWIASIFSPEAIRKGSFDKYAESNKKKRGTAGVDDAFLKEIEAWRSDLASNLALRNAELSQREINFAVQKTIDRIIFLRICEDRGIEAYGGLQALLNGAKVYDRLCESFRHADDRYNSGLFHFTKEKNRSEDPDQWTLALRIDDRVLKDIIRNLYYPESPYEFSVMPAEILGQVYEQFLGKVIRLTKGHQAKVEDKPEVKKAGGVYYTPKYIVDYIVEQTVGKLLEGKTPNEIAARTKTWKPAKGGRPLTVLDPACGSGSFLIGAYQYLLDWYRDWYVEHDPAKHKDRIYQVRQDQWRLTTAERKRILLDHIYGVDIDTQAVEVTKLSLLLKVLEGENQESLQRQLRLFRERALPDLADNIKCGNSLIGPDFYQGKQLDLFDKDERLRINDFDWFGKRGFHRVMDAGGFHAVIGNPPYRREFGYKALLDEIASAPWGAKYRVARMDLWYYFVHRGLELLRPDGLLSFIVNAYWTASTGARGLIAAIRSTTHVEEIFSLGKLTVFEHVAGQHMMFRLAKRITDSPTIIKVVQPDDERDAGAFVTGAAPVLLYEKNHSQLFLQDKVDLQPANDELFKRFLGCTDLGKLGALRQGIVANPPTVSRRSNSALGDQWNVGEGVFTLLPGELKRLAIPDDERQIVVPFHDLCDLARYSIASVPSRFIIYSTATTWPNLNDYPTLKNHLARFRPIMEKRRETQQGKVAWWQLHWPREQAIWESHKIVCVRMAERPSFIAAHQSLYVPYTAIAYIPNPSLQVDLDYICAILNSRLIWKWFIHHAKRRGIGLEIDNNVLEYAPIKIVDLSERNERKLHDELANQSRTMHAINAKKSAAKITHERTALAHQLEATDREIDRLVYELYGLTEVEIRIVEEATAR